MRKHLMLCLIFLVLAPAHANSSGNWVLDSSDDAYWIKTVNSEQHELLVAYHDDIPKILLILKTDSLLPDKILPVTIRIDQDAGQVAQLQILEKRPGQTVMQINLKRSDTDRTLLRMIAGLSMVIDFDFLLKQNTDASDQYLEKFVVFSLKDFTFAINNLFIVNDIGSLNEAWLLRHNKDRELYCLMTTNISIEAIRYRLSGKRYDDVLKLIAKTGYSIIDHNLGEIIEQVFTVSLDDLPYVPRAEKYLLFSRCMAQPFNLRQMK